MRNLKRALSLALASVMLPGMMVVGAGAASYPDVDSRDNVEAIEVLNAVGAIEAAAMMLRALGYEKLEQNAADWRTPWPPGPTRPSCSRT